MNWAFMSDYLSTMDVVLLSANLLLLLFSRPLLKWVFPAEDSKAHFNRRLSVFRIANIIAMVFVVSNAVMHPEGGTVVLTRTLGVPLAIYVGWLIFFILSRMIRRRWGYERKRGEETVFVETYNSRLLTLIVGVVISIMVLVAVIRILGYSSLLEAGGVLGVLGVMLALTQASWVPDLVSGLVILNSRLIAEGDIIQLGEDNSQVGMVFRTKVFFTEILHLANNHRILIQNTKLRNMTVHNLSRFASAKGLREALSINVSYAVTEEQVNRLFLQVIELSREDPDLPIENQYEVEIRATKGGDYAVQWTCFYYIKETRQVLKIRQLMLALLLKVAREQNISLQTPILYQMEPGSLSSSPLLPENVGE
ncbi:MAG TPA: mechanosensitive ion channel family protein [Chromatiaceae bacterium]|nr:mechanosensitive ion channel family protein [Chromatiaceae bacterium]